MYFPPQLLSSLIVAISHSRNLFSAASSAQSDPLGVVEAMLIYPK